MTLVLARLPGLPPPAPLQRRGMAGMAGPGCACEGEGRGGEGRGGEEARRRGWGGRVDALCHVWVGMRVVGGQTGHTALMVAAMEGRHEVVKALVANGANLEAKNLVRVSGSGGGLHAHLRRGVDSDLSSACG